MKNNLKFLEVKSGLCAPCTRGKLGAELGIDAIKNAALTDNCYMFLTTPHEVVIDIEDNWTYSKENIVIYKNDIIYKYPNDRFARHIKYLNQCYTKISDSVKKSLDDGKFPFILAGDHSTAGATIAGIKKKYPDKRLGVVWIDAHADLHSPYTTPSGNMHGMPLALALGLNDKDAKLIQNGLKEIGLKGNYNVISQYEKDLRNQLCNAAGVYPMISSNDIVFIGIRDLEPEEQRYVDKNIKNFNGKYIQNYGINGILDQTFSHLSNCDMIYVSFDIDSIDGQIVHGTGTPVPDGLSTYQAKELLKGFYEYHKTVAMEIVEINPLLDDTVGNNIDSDGNTKKSDFETCNGTAEIAFKLIRDTISYL